MISVEKRREKEQMERTEKNKQQETADKKQQEEKKEKKQQEEKERQNPDKEPQLWHLFKDIVTPSLTHTETVGQPLLVRSVDPQTIQRQPDEASATSTINVDQLHPVTEILVNSQEHPPEVPNQEFEVFSCPTNTVTKILGGAMMIRCTVNPVTVKARMCLPTEFDRIADVLSAQKEVSEK